MTTTADYPLPSGELSLSGPVERPAPGTLPIRGDLAHIALAPRFLVAHYVVPQPRQIGEAGAELLAQPAEGAQGVARLDPGARFEALDYAGEWCWGCCGPEGPSGYLRTALLAPTSSE
ncbi:MAG: hypothetical protein ACTHKM_13090 [Tsuneonella sp.]